MKELSKEKLLDKLTGFYACYDLNCESPVSEDAEVSLQAYRQIRKLIEEKPKVTREWIGKWGEQFLYSPPELHATIIKAMLKEVGVET